MGNVSPRALQVMTEGIPPPDTPDVYIGGHAGIAAEFVRRGLTAPSRSTLYRMWKEKKTFPAPTVLGAEPDNPRSKRDWRRSTVLRWFEEREQRAQA